MVNGRLRSIWVFGLAAALLLSACGAPAILEDVSIAPIRIDPASQAAPSRATIRFILNTDARVSVYLVDEAGVRYVFRDDLLLAARRRPYSLDFNGVVDGYSLPDEALPYTVLTRLVPAGPYGITLSAVTSASAAQSYSSTLELVSEAPLPGIEDFRIDPDAITPNEDGIHDVAEVTLRLTTGVEQLSVYARGADRQSYPLEEVPGVDLPNTAGLHTFVFDTRDVPSGAPDDGLYHVYATARDGIGQETQVDAPLTLELSGRPSAYIVGGDVRYSADTLSLGETLCFSLTVTNDGPTPIRTSGPPPGTTYRSDQNFVTLSGAEDEGAFRIALDYEKARRQYPFRWAIGQQGVDLVQMGEGWYLLPGNSARVSGCVQFVEPLDPPVQYVWVGLLHEQAQYSIVNHRVAPHLVTQIP